MKSLRDELSAARSRPIGADTWIIWKDVQNHRFFLLGTYKSRHNVNVNKTIWRKAGKDRKLSLLLLLCYLNSGKFRQCRYNNNRMFQNNAIFSLKKNFFLFIMCAYEHCSWKSDKTLLLNQFRAKILNNFIKLDIAT